MVNTCQQLCYVTLVTAVIPDIINPSIIEPSEGQLASTRSVAETPMCLRLKHTYVGGNNANSPFHQPPDHPRNPHIPPPPHTHTGRTCRYGVRSLRGGRRRAVGGSGGGGGRRRAALLLLRRLGGGRRCDRSHKQSILRGEP